MELGLELGLRALVGVLLSYPFWLRILPILQAQSGWMALPVPVTWPRLRWKRPCSQLEIPTPLTGQTSLPRGKDLEKEIQGVRKNSPVFLTCQVL